MNNVDFENELFRWLQLPTGTKITDAKTIGSFVGMAKAYDGGDTGMIDSVKVALEEYTKLNKTAIDDVVKHMRCKAALGEVPETVEDYVDAYARKYGVCLTLDRRLRMGGGDADDGDVYNAMYLFTARIQRFKEESYLKAAWRMWKAERTKANYLAFRGKIAFNPAADASLWDKVVDLVVRDDGDNPHYKEICKAVLQGAIWRVKNKMAGRPTRQHIMPYLRSKQGGGKTTFMEWFFKPVEDGVLNTDFKMFEHDEKLSVLKSTPIIFFDEVAKADKADAATVKNLMTTKSVMMRKLYGEASKGDVISTFFGAGNLELAEVFSDSTGLRRYWQIEVNHILWDAMKALEGDDPLALWQSVNENDVSPVETKEMISLLIEAQSDQKTLTPIERWLEGVCIRGGTQEFKDAEDLFGVYVEWAKNNYPNDRTNVESFSRQLGRILKDCGEAYPHEAKKHSRTRRMTWKFGAVNNVIDMKDTGVPSGIEALKRMGASDEQLRIIKKHKAD